MPEQPVGGNRPPLRVKRHNTDTMELTFEEAVARSDFSDPDGAMIAHNVKLARSVLAAAGHDPARSVTLLDGLRITEEAASKLGVEPIDAPAVETIDRELAAQIVRHGEGMARALEKLENNPPARQLRYHALRFMRAIHEAAQLGAETGRPPKVTWELIDQVEREGRWQGKAFAYEVARRAGVHVSNVYKALQARRRK